MTINIEERKKYFDKLESNKPITFLDSGRWSFNLHLIYDITRLYVDGNDSVAFGYHGIRKTDTDQYVIMSVEDCDWCDMEELISARRNSFRRVIYDLYLRGSISESKFLSINEDIKNMTPTELGFDNFVPTTISQEDTEYEKTLSESEYKSFKEWEKENIKFIKQQYESNR